MPLVGLQNSFPRRAQHYADRGAHNKKGSGMEILVRPRTIAKILAWAVLALTIFHLLTLVSIFYFDQPKLFGLVPLFNFDSENNIPSLFSAALFLFCALLLVIIGSAQRHRGAKFALHWILLGALFVFLGIDEATHLHERLTVPVRNALNLSGVLYFGWVVPYIVMCVVLGIAYVSFWFSLPARTQVNFVIAAGLFLSGAIGFELLGAREFEAGRAGAVLYALYYTAEEFLEFSGLVAFVYALLSYVGEGLRGLRLGINQPVHYAWPHLGRRSFALKALKSEVRGA